MGATVVVIKKTSPEYALGEQPPCPSVKVNDEYIVKRGCIIYEQLKAALEKN